MTRRDGDEGSQPTLWVSLEAEAVHTLEHQGEPSRVPVSVRVDSHPAISDELWERVFASDNLLVAVRKVEGNGGAPGVDGMTVGELSDWLESGWPRVRDCLEAGTYRPVPVRRVEIPKPDGGSRLLGVPTVVDRVLQQAISQVLVPIFDPGFSESSFGFRPGRSAHGAVEQARGYIEDGLGWAVDVDLDRFFDRVNHDMVMARVARRIADKRLLGLMRAFLNAGVMIGGVEQATREGTPQGSPLSPLLSNIMLDDLDRELESRGHRFVRYADDVRIYVRSQRAAQRVLESVSEFVEKRLKLKVNRDKSGIGPATAVFLLGFGFFLRNGAVMIRVAPGAKRAMKQRIRRLTSRSWGVSMPYRIEMMNRFIRGWSGYYAVVDTPSVFTSVDGWVRRRLRQVLWIQWKTRANRRRNLRRLGIAPRDAAAVAASSRGSWSLSHSPALQRGLPVKYWVHRGLVGFEANYHRFHPDTQ